MAVFYIVVASALHFRDEKYHIAILTKRVTCVRLDGGTSGSGPTSTLRWDRPTTLETGLVMLLGRYTCTCSGHIFARSIP